MEMTLEELIIGHYEEALSPVQEKELNTIIQQDAKAKSMFEEYGKVESLMMEDVAETNTDDRLDKAVLAAAISAGAATVISGGTQTASWITGKMGMIGGAVVAGAVGTAAYFGLFKGKTETQPEVIKTPPPAVSTTPAPKSEPLNNAMTTPVIEPKDNIKDEPKKAANPLTKTVTKAKLKPANVNGTKPQVKKRPKIELPDAPDAEFKGKGINTK